MYIKKVQLIIFRQSMGALEPVQNLLRKSNLNRVRGMKPRTRPKGRELRLSPFGNPHLLLSPQQAAENSQIKTIKASIAMPTLGCLTFYGGIADAVYQKSWGTGYPYD